MKKEKEEEGSWGPDSFYHCCKKKKKILLFRVPVLASTPLQALNQASLYFGCVLHCPGTPYLGALEGCCIVEAVRGATLLTSCQCSSPSKLLCIYHLSCGKRGWVLQSLEGWGSLFENWKIAAPSTFVGLPQTMLGHLRGLSRARSGSCPRMDGVSPIRCWYGSDVSNACQHSSTSLLLITCST